MLLGTGTGKEGREEEEERVVGGCEVKGGGLGYFRCWLRCCGLCGVGIGIGIGGGGLDEPAAGGFGRRRGDGGELEEAGCGADEVAGGFGVARVLEGEDAGGGGGGFGEDEEFRGVGGLGGEGVD